MGVTFGAKPSAIAPRINHPTLPGCKVLLPFANAGYAATNHAAADVLANPAYTGAPTWGTGPCGPQLGGISTSAFLSVDGVAASFAAAYPFWLAAVSLNTATTAGTFPIVASNTGSGNSIIGLAYNNGTTGSICYFVRDEANAHTTSTVSYAVSCNDGLPHLFMGISLANNDHRNYWDGIQVGQNTAAMGSFTLNTLTVGALRRASVSNAFTGSVIWGAVGWGAVPNPIEVYARMWEHLRPSRRRSVGYVAATGKVPWHLFFNSALGQGAA